jgi:hypothetical protein
LVEITGKRGRIVPMILTPDCKKSIELLIETRETVGVPETNPYVFARANNNSNNCVRGWDCLKKLTKELELERPAALTSTKLSKYVATVAQVASLTETDVDWLARHLGHDIRIHCDFYMLHNSAIELAKVSKLLLTVDSGELNRLKGKPLKEIDMDGKQVNVAMLSFTYSITRT